MISGTAAPAEIDAELAQLRRLAAVSWVEGTTLLLLVTVAAPLKHLAGWGAASSLMGPVHGLAFLAYLWTVIETVSGGGWSRREIVRLAAVSFVPFGGFTNGRFLRWKAALLRASKQSGPWQAGART